MIKRYIRFECATYFMSYLELHVKTLGQSDATRQGKCLTIAMLKKDEH